MRISDWSSDVCSSDLWTAFDARRLHIGRKCGKVSILPWRVLRTIRSALSSPPREARLDHNRRDPGRRVQRSRQARSAGQRTGPTHLHGPRRSEEHTSELQSLMRTAYAVFSLKKE